MGSKKVPLAQERVDSGESIDDAFREYAAELWRALYVYTGGRGEIADEATAEAFTRAIPQRGSIRDLRPWLYRVAFRVARTELDREQREVGETEDQGDEPADLDELRRVLDALTELPPKQRAAIVLYYRVDLPVREVAAILGVSTHTAKVHLHRGRNRLRQLLGEDSDE
jgi:RNA polymerase sigma-70 factor (ECF subfamily)